MYSKSYAQRKEQRMVKATITTRRPASVEDSQGEKCAMYK